MTAGVIQDVVALALVVVITATAGWRWWRARGSGGGCTGCAHGCALPRPTAGDPPHRVQLQPPQRRTHEERV